MAPRMRGGSQSALQFVLVTLIPTAPLPRSILAMKCGGLQCWGRINSRRLSHAVSVTVAGRFVLGRRVGPMPSILVSSLSLNPVDCKLNNSSSPSSAKMNITPAVFSNSCCHCIFLATMPMPKAKGKQHWPDSSKTMLTLEGHTLPYSKSPLTSPSRLLTNSMKTTWHLLIVNLNVTSVSGCGVCFLSTLVCR